MHTVFLHFSAARTLETLIRLSTAHARVCLRNEIIEKDVEAAIRILNFALYQVIPKTRTTHISEYHTYCTSKVLRSRAGFP
jgi:DNA replicative helicase MCM subunit Mcm2 (Cdc46/Mcm family)